MPASYGFADMVFVPLPSRDKPSMVVELKWNKKCETDLDQIRDNIIDCYHVITPLFDLDL